MAFLKRLDERRMVAVFYADHVQLEAHVRLTLIRAVWKDVHGWSIALDVSLFRSPIVGNQLIPFG